MSIGTPPLLSGPIAPESNPPINPQYFMPSLFDIAALSYGITTIVTTTVNHNYVVGQNVRLIIPSPYGGYPLSGQQGYVITVPSPTQVEVAIDSIVATPFNSSIPISITPPQIAAIGDVNSGQINSNGRIQNGTTIQGSFQNISPL